VATRNDEERSAPSRVDRPTNRLSRASRLVVNYSPIVAIVAALFRSDLSRP